MARPVFKAAPARVRVPATSANLGPGFDAFGLALALYDDVVARVVDDGLSVDVAGEGADTLPRDGRHLLVKAMRASFAAMGGQPRGLEVVCANRIPQRRGLGSSAAAIVGGILAARALTVGGAQLLPDDAVLSLAASIEGHPDNVAACLTGGLTLSWLDGAQARRVAFPVEEGVRVTAYVPPTTASTSRARRLLPATVPHPDAAHAVARAALLPTAFGRDPQLLFTATEDRLHQSYRAPAMPRSMGFVGRLRARGLAAVLSGAGPTVLLLSPTPSSPAPPEPPARGWLAMPLAVDREGARVGGLEADEDRE